MIKLHDVHKVYLQGKIGFHALKGINLYFEKGEFVSIFGPSGCGKTTLLNIIGGLDLPTSGDMVIKDRLTTNFIEKEWDYFRNYSIGFIFQQYNLIEHLPIVENVALSLKLAGASSKKAKEEATNLLIKVGLENHLTKLPNELSGGERQRVAIARALINDPEVILADEPTGALDNKTGMEIMDLIKSICSDKLVIVVTHNKKIAEKYSTRLIELKDGVVIQDTKPEDKRVKIINTRTKNRKKLSFKEALRLSYYNIKGKFVRTLLVSLGLSVGIVGLILIDSLFNSIRGGLEQQSAVLKNNPDMYIHEEYTPDYNIVDQQNDLNDYGYFKEILYAPRTPFIITQNATDQTDLSDNVYASGIEKPSNQDILDTFTRLVGDSRFPQNDNEMLLPVSVAQQLISSNVNFTNEELWDQIKNKEYVLYNEYDYIPTQGSAYNQLLGGTCMVTGVWDENPANVPTGYDATILGDFTVNMTNLSAYRSIPIQISDTEQLYCADYDTLTWQLDYSSPIGSSMTVKVVGIQDNNLFNEIVFSDNIISVVPYQAAYIDPDNTDGSIIDSSIRYRVFINNDNIDNKAAIILQLEDDGYYTQDNVDLGLNIFAGVANLFMYILQFIFSSIVFIAIVTGGLMLLLILLISIIERKREIGLIRAMGGTRSDVRTIYTGETTIIGLIAGAFSVVLSIILVIILNAVIYNNYFDLVIEYLPFVDPRHVLTINFTKLLLAILGSIAIAVVSGLIPSIRAGRKKPIEALRNE